MVLKLRGTNITAISDNLLKHPRSATLTESFIKCGLPLGMFIDAVHYVSGKTYTIHLHSHHAWVSFEAQAEVFNETMRLTNNANYVSMQSYLSQHPFRISAGECKRN